ncbi:hypothetical protein OEZ86_000278 [Tetradesmus obliquus]|nr:hypothetical protein OEZ86_000278 [Tetradesmus obliquus]
MLGTIRQPSCLQGKAARTGPGLVSSGSRRVTRKRAQAFKGSRRALVTVAAAESEAPAPAAPAPARRPRNEGKPLTAFEANEIVEGRVTSVQSFGAFVDIGAESQGLIHISQLTDGFVKNAIDVIKVGETIKARVLSVDVAGKRLALTRKGMGVGGSSEGRRGGGRNAREEEEDDVEEEDIAVDPTTAELDGLTFVVEDDEEDTADIDPAELEFVDELSAEDARDIALALEDLVSGTVTAVDASGVTVSYSLEDGSSAEGLIHVSELLAPSHLVEGEEAEDEAEAYTEVDNIDPAVYYKVGDSISCFVMDVEDGTPLLTQRLTEDADDELAEFAEMLEETNVDDLSDAAIIQGMWAAAEDAAGDDDEAEDGDALLEQLDPAEGAVAAAGADEDDEEGMVSVVPEDLRLEVLAARRGGASRSSRLVGPLAGVRLPDRPVGVDPTNASNATLLDAFSGELEEDEDECIGVAVNDTSYVPASLLKRLGYKIVQAEEGGEWGVVRREGAAEEGEAEMDAELAAELEAVASGLYDARAVDSIVKDLMAGDEEADEAEVPRLARRNPVVAAAAVSAGISAKAVSSLRKKTGAGMMDCKKALGECAGDEEKAVEWLRQKGLSGADKKAGRVAAEGAIVRYIHPGSRLGVLLEVNCETDFVAAGDVFTKLAGEIAMVVASSEVVCVSVDDMPGDLLAKEREVEMGKEDIKAKPEAVRAKIVEGRLDKIKRAYALLEQPALRDNNKTVAEIIKEAIAATGENIQVRRFIKYNLGEGLEKRSNDFAAEVAQQTAKKAEAPAAKKEEPKKEEAPKEAKPAVQVSAALVKQLRDKSGAGMMDCKKALGETGGDVEAAVEWLRKKGLSSADKKAGRLAAEGGIVAYIHPGSRLGVLLEVNCETDFVAAGDVFGKLANTLAMQIAANPSLEYVTPEEVPEELLAREREIEMGREDLQAKPEAIRAKIAEGRVKKLAQERVLLEQPYLLDESKTVSEAVKEAIASCGENIQIRRFSRFVLGEGVEKKVSNLAEEVAAATGAKA